jgi:hypothetical protein
LESRACARRQGRGLSASGASHRETWTESSFATAAFSYCRRARGIALMATLATMLLTSMNYALSLGLR